MRSRRFIAATAISSVAFLTGGAAVPMVVATQAASIQVAAVGQPDTLFHGTLAVGQPDTLFHG